MAAARAVFGGGEALKPIEIYLEGHATEQFEGVTVPIRELAIEGARQWLDSNLHAPHSERHVRLHCLIRPSSRDLADLHARGRADGETPYGLYLTVTGISAEALRMPPSRSRPTHNAL